MTLHFRVGHVDAAAKLVKKYHYSGRAPTNVQIVGTWHESGGLFGDYGDCAAACFFCIPPTRWSEDVLELARLVRRPEITEPLSALISATCRHMKKHKIGDLLVSFADRTQKHHGGIYQAASWNYAGCREKQMDGLMINSVFVPGRSCNASYGTRSPVKMAEKFPQWKIEPHYDEGKHLYWRSLSRTGEERAGRLGLQKLPYVKPDISAASPGHNINTGE